MSTPELTLTEEQEQAVKAFEPVYRGQKRRVTIGGYAGTGKSTVISEIVRRYPDVAVCTPTGKAAHVLRSKGVEACTLHSLIYRPRGVDEYGEVQFATTQAPLPRVAIIDEASMLSEVLVRDLERKIRHVLYVGDHGQLEPIGDDPGLMAEPDVRLETIHRQASGSPIVRFAHHVRAGGTPRSFGPLAAVHKWTSELADFDVVLVGYNSSRIKVNNWMRKRKGFSGELPQPGEQVICLRNNKDFGVWNGLTGVVLDIDAETRIITVAADDGEERRVPFDPAQFGQERTLPWVKPRGGKLAPTLWDFGYALTVHKAQGSEWPRVAVVDEDCSLWSMDRWRYTAATRASEQLRWVYK